MPEGFTGINYQVCSYCTHEVHASDKMLNFQGCAIQKTSDGRYAPITIWGPALEASKAQGELAINARKGCEKFESSGLPAHPSVKEQLIKNNPLASTIPEDENATETSWDFDDKSVKFQKEASGRSPFVNVEEIY